MFALCKRRGLALPASMTAPDTAVVFQGKTYGFADEYGAKLFASQPEKYVRAMHATLFRMRSWCGSPTPRARRRRGVSKKLDVVKLGWDIRRVAHGFSRRRTRLRRALRR